MPAHPSASHRPRVAVFGLPGHWSSDTLCTALSRHFGEVPGLDLAQATLRFDDARVMCQGYDLTTFDAVVVKKIAPEYRPDVMSRIDILRWLEHRGVRVFSPADSLATLVDRLSGTRILRRAGIPMPDTRVTCDLEQARDAVLEFGEAVVKPLFTSKGRGMRVVAQSDDVEAELAAFRDEGYGMYYIQRKIELPGRDLGLVFVGGKFLASYARVSAQGAWSTTTQSGGRYEASEVSPELIELAHRSQACLPLDFTCVDIAETRDGPCVFEVSAFGGFRGLKEAYGIDAAAVYADHVAQVLERHHA